MFQIIWALIFVIKIFKKSMYCTPKMIDMFLLFKMPKRRTFGYFLTSSEDKIFFVKKDPENRERMVSLCLRSAASQ